MQRLLEETLEELGCVILWNIAWYHAIYIQVSKYHRRKIIRVGKIFTLRNTRNDDNFVSQGYTG